MMRVLVAPLDWGLGHATRCIPIIREILSRGNEVLIAGSGASLKLLQEEFPDIRYFTLPGYDPTYPLGNAMVLKMTLQLPKFFRTIKREHERIAKIVSEEAVDMIVSDNRYGCWSDDVPCIFITHQSNILMPKRFGWLQGLIRYVNVRYMKRFSRCWIPDYPLSHSLAGDLVAFGNYASSLKVDFIGPLSRFRASGVVEKKYDVVAIFSGPEPQRTLLEEKVLPQLKSSGLKYFVVRGIFSEKPLAEKHVVNFLTSDLLQLLIESSEMVIVRSGYSTVMDLAALGKKAIFIPTPGQTEQEYLAQRLLDNGICYFVKQKDFKLSEALENAREFPGFEPRKYTVDYLNKALDEVLISKNMIRTSA